MIEVQTRSEDTGLQHFASVRDAIEAAERDETIWKISFNLGAERIRLVKQTLYSSAHVKVFWWKYEPI